MDGRVITSVRIWVGGWFIASVHIWVSGWFITTVRDGCVGGLHHHTCMGGSSKIGWKIENVLKDVVVKINYYLLSAFTNYIITKPKVTYHFRSSVWFCLFSHSCKVIWWLCLDQLGSKITRGLWFIEKEKSYKSKAQSVFISIRKGGWSLECRLIRYQTANHIVWLSVSFPSPLFEVDFS